MENEFNSSSSQLQSLLLTYSLMKYGPVVTVYEKPIWPTRTVLICWYGYWVFLSSDVFYGFSCGLNSTELCLVGFTIAGKDWGQEEKKATEDEVVGYHHWLNGYEFEQTLGDSKGQGSQACCSPWGHKETWISDWTMTTTTTDHVEHWQSQSQSQEWFHFIFYFFFFTNLFYWSIVDLRRRQWHPTPVFLPGESQGRGSLVGYRLWGHTESDTTEVT